jgi:Zn finger protein HypA/HybF involved in hydrogenase expression
VKTLRFTQVRNARRVLDMKGRTAAAIIGIPYADLRKGERVDAIVPTQHTHRARQLIGLAVRGGKKLANHRLAGKPRLTAALPFPRPRCRSCRHLLYIVGSNHSKRRGRHWYFKCPVCGHRYWSNRGGANVVRPKGGNWRQLKGRVECETCAVECSRKSRYWECPLCRKHYRNVNGRAIPTVPGSHPLIALPFLPTRECSIAKVPASGFVCGPTRPACVTFTSAAYRAEELAASIEALAV